MITLEMEKQPAGYSLKASVIILLPNFLIDEIELAVKMVSDAPLQSCLILAPLWKLLQNSSRKEQRVT